MLKIKSNTNEFTIIFFKKIGKKKNAQKISFSLYSVQHPFFVSPSFLLVSVSFLFSASVFSAPLCFFSAPPLFFSVHVCPFFSPKTFFSAQNNSLFSPKSFFSAQNVLPSAQNLFQFSPHHCFSLFLFCFSLFSFCWFYFQRTFSFCSAPPFFFFFFQRLILFSLDVLLFIFQPKIPFQPKTFFNPSSAQDTFSSAPLFFCACLLLSFLPTSKAKNILSICFTFLLFE